MKITFNGKITTDIIDKMLQNQAEKKARIIKFCQDQKIPELQYKDSELEFTYTQSKVETRPKQVNKEIRKGE